MSRDLQDGQLWVLRYSNTDATHVEVFECEDAAWVGACLLVLDNLNEVDDWLKEDEILTEIENEYMRSAVKLYTDALVSESFEIFERPLCNPTIGLLKKRVEESRQRFNEARMEPQAP